MGLQKKFGRAEASLKGKLDGFDRKYEVAFARIRSAGRSLISPPVTYFHRAWTVWADRQRFCEAYLIHDVQPALAQAREAYGSQWSHYQYWKETEGAALLIKSEAAAAALLKLTWLDGLVCMLLAFEWYYTYQTCIEVMGDDFKFQLLALVVATFTAAFAVGVMKYASRLANYFTHIFFVGLVITGVLFVQASVVDLRASESVSEYLSRMRHQSGHQLQQDAESQSQRESNLNLYLIAAIFFLTETISFAQRNPRKAGDARTLLDNYKKVIEARANCVSVDNIKSMLETRLAEYRGKNRSELTTEYQAIYSEGANSFWSRALHGNERIDQVLRSSGSSARGANLVQTTST